MHAASVRLFGSTTVIREDASLTGSALGGVKIRRILRILALQHGVPVAKDRLAELLWDGSPPSSHKSDLESYICVLRRKMGVGSGRHSVVATTSGGYLLDPDKAEVDHDEFTRLAACARAQPLGQALLVAQRALSLVRGELLADEPYPSWAERARERHTQEERSLCLLATRSALIGGDLECAVHMAHRAQVLNPLSDETAQHLMRALWLAGRRADALQSYLTLRRALREELGEEPDHGTHELYLAILQQDFEPFGGHDARADLRILLELLRQTLDGISGMRAPASNAALAAHAMAALAQRPSSGQVLGATRELSV